MLPLKFPSRAFREVLEYFKIQKVGMNMTFLLILSKIAD